MQTTPLVSTKWKWRIALIGVLLVFVAFWAATFAYHRIAKARYESYVAELAAKGESLDVDDLRPPPIENPEDDVAQAPVFAEFLERCRANPSDDLKDDPVLGVLDLERVEGYSQNRSNPGSMPAIRYFRESSVSLGFESPDDLAAASALLKHADSNSLLLDEIRDALARPRIDFRVPYGDFTQPMPGISEFHGLSKVLHRQARAALLLGRQDLALSNSLALLRISKHFASQRYLIYILLGDAWGDNALSVVREGLATGRWREGDLKILAEELKIEWIEACFLEAVRMERATAVEHFGRAKHDSSYWDERGERWIYAIPDLRYGRCYDNMEFYSRKLQENILEDSRGKSLNSHFAVPFKHALPTIVSGAGWRERLRVRFQRLWHAATQGSVSSFAFAQVKTLRFRVCHDHTRIAIALELHRLRHGSLPATLDALTLPNGDALPLDPFTGANYVYHLETVNDYVLYSPGPNGVDEGGMIRKSNDDGDWVWRLRLPADFDYDAYRGR